MTDEKRDPQGGPDPPSGAPLRADEVKWRDAILDEKWRREERQAWDIYAANALLVGSYNPDDTEHAAAMADALLTQRRKRFGSGT